MTEELEQPEHAASEQAMGESQEHESEQKMVPLSALEAERRKRQEETSLRKEAEERSRLYQEYLMQAKQEKEDPEEDPNALVEAKDLKETVNMTKREILEQLYQDMNPEAVQNINKHLKNILEKKPWLAASVDSAPNRYARANEIVNDYIHLVETPKAVKSSAVADAQKMVQNANKPRSPVELGKSAQPGGMEFLKSMQGKKEFREYRQKLLKGDA